MLVWFNIHLNGLTCPRSSTQTNLVYLSIMNRFVEFNIFVPRRKFRATTRLEAEIQSSNRGHLMTFFWKLNAFIIFMTCMWSKSVQLSVWIKLTLSVYKLRNSIAERWVCIILHYMQVFSIICFTDSFVGVWAVQLSAIHSLWINMCHSTDYHVSCQPVTFL